MALLPEELVQNNSHARGAEGLAWLERIPAIIAELEQRWSITVDAPFTRLSFNYVAPAVQADGTQAVLKLSLPGDPETLTEADALRVFDGRGMTRLHELDLRLGAMLLERLQPGTPLHRLRDEEQEISIAAAVMRRLWRAVPADHAFPTVARWGQAFDRHRAEHGGTSGPLPQEIFNRGDALYHELDRSATEHVLLHGDLHHDNILASEREDWLAIDPKGVVGDPVSEVGPFIRNLWEDLYEVPDPDKILIRRVDQLSEELGFDRGRVRDWTIAHCVLSAVWSAENHGTNWHGAMKVAAVLVP